MPEINKIDENVKQLLNVSLFGASIATSQGEIIFANQSLLNLFKSTEENFVGRMSKEFYAHEEQRTLIMSELQKNNAVKDTSVLLKRDDGSHFWASLSFAMSEYAGEDCYFCWFYDVTERIEMENSLREQTERAARTGRLSAQAELVKRAAHEINNPLTVIRGTIFALKKELEKDNLNKENLVKVVEKASNAINRIAEGIETIREVAKK